MAGHADADPGRDRGTRASGHVSMEGGVDLRAREDVRGDGPGGPGGPAAVPGGGGAPRGGPPPGVARVGRPPRTIPEEERAFILQAEDEERLNPVALERAIERYRGIHIPHNRIWRVLKEGGRGRNEPRKQKRRGGARVERGG